MGRLGDLEERTLFAVIEARHQHLPADATQIAHIISASGQYTEPNKIYPTVLRLEGKGLLQSRMQPTFTQPRRVRRLYTPTELGLEIALLKKRQLQTLSAHVSTS